MVKHCPTREMAANNFTKPLQGEFFQKFREEIQGIPATLTDKEMCHDVPGPLNMAPKTANVVTRKPSTKGCVGGERNYDLHMDTS